MRAITACYFARKERHFFLNYEHLLSEETLTVDHRHTVHFWNAMVTAANMDKDGRFPPKTVLERLKRRYL